MIGFSFSRFLLEVFWPSWSYSMPWKTREGYQFWGKSITSELERRFHEKGCGLMRAFVSGKGSVEVLGTKVKGECGEHRWNHLTFTLPLYLCGQRVFFILSPLKHTTLELFLAAVASCLPYDDSMTWPNPESLHLTSLYIPAQDNEDPNASIWLVIYALQQPMMALGYLTSQCTPMPINIG